MTPCLTPRRWISHHCPFPADFSQGLQLIMRYFVGTELGVANLLQRHFDWSSNSLWYEEIPGARDPVRTMFFLGGKDAIVCAEVRPTA